MRAFIQVNQSSHARVLAGRAGEDETGGGLNLGEGWGAKLGEPNVKCGLRLCVLLPCLLLFSFQCQSLK